MPDPFPLIGKHRVKADVLHAAEDAFFHAGVLLFQLADQLLDLLPLGVVLAVVAGGAGVGELAGALDEVQVVLVPPRLDVVLAD